MSQYIIISFIWVASTSSLCAATPLFVSPGAVMPKEGFRYPTPFKYPSTTFRNEAVVIEKEDVAIDKEKEIEIEKKIELTEKKAPRMSVKGFRIVGVDDENGITQGIINELVRVKAEDMLKQEASKGFTISMFDTITKTISRYYRQQGYILAKAYIPEQSINDGIVQINVVEGFLDQVVFTNNKLYSDTQLSKPFEKLIGKSVFKQDIEQVLFKLNDYPGLNANMVFGPGLKAGSSAIQVNTVEVPTKTTFSFDNYGSTFTGENRLRLNHVRYNTFSQADELKLNAILTQSPDNSQYFDGAYEQPLTLWGKDVFVGGGVKINSFDVGGNLSDLGINGTSNVIHSYMRYVHKRDRAEKLSATLSLSLKSSESLIQSTSDSKDNLTVLSISGDYAGTSWSSSQMFQSINLTLSIGLADFLGSMDSNGNGTSGRTGGSDDLAGGDFSKLSFAYHLIQNIAPLQTITYSLKGQRSSDLLTSLEQYSLGGVDNVRAYPVAEALMDTVTVASIEWTFYASPDIAQTWFNKLQFSIFYDLAKGKLNDPLTNDVSSVSYSDIGASIKIEPFNQVKINASFAVVTGDEEDGERSWPFYLSVAYEF